MSTLEVNKITPQGTGTTVTLGDSGDTFTIPSGVTLTNNGSANGFGKIGQVIQATTSTESTNTSSSYADTGLSASITPTSTSSKVLVLCSVSANMGTGGHNVPIIKDAKGIRKLTPLECVRLQGFPFGA